MSQKKFRDEYGLFVVEGERLVEEALKSGFKVEAVYRRDEIGEAAMSRISSLNTPPPALAVVRIPDAKVRANSGSSSAKDHTGSAGKATVGRNSSESVTFDKNTGFTENQIVIPNYGLLLGLDAIRDPGNLGTILRTADWFGIKDVYASFDTAELYNPKVVQATMGAIFRVRVHYCDLPAAQREVISRGGRVYGTFLDGEDMYACDLDPAQERPVMVIIGNEANGISPESAAEVTDRILIPRYGDSRCESLNAASAAAVVIAEFRRRTRQ